MLIGLILVAHDTQWGWQVDDQGVALVSFISALLVALAMETRRNDIRQSGARIQTVQRHMGARKTNDPVLF